MAESKYQDLSVDDAAWLVYLQMVASGEVACSEVEKINAPRVAFNRALSFEAERQDRARLRLYEPGVVGRALLKVMGIEFEPIPPKGERP